MRHGVKFNVAVNEALRELSPVATGDGNIVGGPKLVEVT